MVSPRLGCVPNFWVEGMADGTGLRVVTCRTAVNVQSYVFCMPGTGFSGQCGKHPPEIRDRSRASILP